MGRAWKIWQHSAVSRFLTTERDTNANHSGLGYYKLVFITCTLYSLNPIASMRLVSLAFREYYKFLDQDSGIYY